MKFMLAATQQKQHTGNNKLIRHLLGQPLSSCVSNGAEYHHRTPETSWGNAQNNNNSTQHDTIQKSLRHPPFICNVISQSSTSSLTRDTRLGYDTALSSYTHLLGAPPSHRWGTGWLGYLAPPGSSLKGHSSYRPAGPASARTRPGRPPPCLWEG